MPELVYFPNYAGKGKEHGIDDILDAELVAAGIPPSQRMESLRGKIGCEIDTVSCGQLGPWFFERYWYYWKAKGPGIPPDDAEALHATHGRECRVDGDCCCPSPREYFGGFAVGHYHIDTTEGLKALADTIKAIIARNGDLPIEEDAEHRATAGGVGVPESFVRGLHYVHVIGYDGTGNEVQLWAGEMNQVPNKGDRIRLRIGESDSYRLLWVEAVAWPLHCDKEGGHGGVGQPFVYVT